MNVRLIKKVLLAIHIKHYGGVHTSMPYSIVRPLVHINDVHERYTECVDIDYLGAMFLFEHNCYHFLCLFGHLIA